MAASKTPRYDAIVKQRVLTLLKATPPSGQALNVLLELYKQNFKAEFDLKPFKVKKASDAFESLSDYCTVSIHREKNWVTPIPGAFDKKENETNSQETPKEIDIKLTPAIEFRQQCNDILSDIPESGCTLEDFHAKYCSTFALTPDLKSFSKKLTWLLHDMCLVYANDGKDWVRMKTEKDCETEVEQAPNTVKTQMETSDKTEKEKVTLRIKDLLHSLPSKSITGFSILSQYHDKYQSYLDPKLFGKEKAAEKGKENRAAGIL